MNSIRLCNGVYFLSSPDTSGLYSKCFSSGAEVTEIEKNEYVQGLGNTVNEIIADELIMTAKKLAIQNSKLQDFQSDEIGISFGSAYGCIEQAIRSRDSIAQKAEKGIRPKEAVNNIPCGAASKAAISLGLKGFNLTNFDCWNAGIDAVIFACDTLSEGRSSCAVAIGGDSGLSFAGVLLESTSECNKGTFITGYSKGLVYGDDAVMQISYLTKEAFRSCETDNADYVFIVDNSNIDWKPEKIKHLINADITVLNFDEKSASSKGIFALGYAKEHMKSETNALIIQISKEGYFSCIVINKK